MTKIHIMPPCPSLAKQLLLSLLCLVFMQTAQAQCPQITNSSLSSTECSPSSAVNLFFSEYVEGSGNNKCLEIFNGTGADIDFSASSYEIQIFNNGASTPNWTTGLIGSIANNDVYILCDNQAGPPLSTLKDQDLLGAYNGDDAIALLHNGVIIDLIGNIGCDPGAAWTAPGISTQNRTIVRNPNVTTGVSTDPPTACPFPTLGTEWTGFPSNTFSNLGSHNYAGTIGGCCDLCPGDQFTVSVLAGSDLPQGGNINWMYSTTPGFDPYTSGTLLGVSPIPVINCLQTSGFHINEIMARPINNDGTSGVVGTGEWIELIGAPGTNIGCTVLTDGDWTVTIPPGTVIPADGFFMIGFAGLTPAAVDLDLFTCGCTTEAGLSVDETLILSNSGEYLAMFDGTGSFLEGVIFGGPTGANAPPMGNLAVGGVVPTAAVPGCSLTSVTIPSVGFATVAPTPSVNTSYIRAPDATGGWTTQSGGSYDDCNVTATGTFPLELTASLSSAFCNQTVYITGAISPFPGGCSTSDPNSTTNEFQVCIICPEATVSGGGAFCLGDPAPDVTFTFTGNPPFDFTYTDGTSSTTITGHGSTTYTITGASPGTYSITSFNDASCTGSSTGSAQVSQLSFNPPTISTTCDPNGTPSDPSDDTYTVSITVTGTFTGTTYNISGDISQSGLNYGQAYNFGPFPISGGNLTIDLTDVSNNCGLNNVSIVAPPTCSDDCDISADGLANVACNNGGTPSNASDDFISFDLNPSGANIGTTYTVSASPGTVSPAAGIYGSSTSFQLQAASAGAGNVTITITDFDDPTCSTTVTITDPGTCSDACNLINPGLSNVACNDNLSNSDPTDDYITFNLNPTGANLGTNFNVSVSVGTVSPTSGLYATGGTFQLQNGSAGNGNVTITITDVDDPACFTSIQLTDPGTCSNACNLSDAGLSNVACNDNLSNSDPTDDYITFDLNPTGANLGTNFNVSVSAGTVSPTSGLYATGGTFQLQNGSAGNGNITITITDVDDPTCSTSIQLTDPGTCSNACNLSDAGLSNVACNDNLSNSDPTDDYITFDLNPTGANLGTNFNVSVSVGTVSPTSGLYATGGTFQLQNGSAGNGNVTITITDVDDPTCFTSIQLTDPGTCSNACNLSDAGLSNVACNDNLSNSDPTDDYITFDLNPTGANLGTNFNVSVSVGTVSPTSGLYATGGTFQLQNGSAGNGNVTITITDVDDPTCFTSIQLTDPGSCSNTCDLNNAGLSNIACNDNLSNSDPTDDYITFDLNPTGVNLGTNFNVSVSSGTVSPTSGLYATGGTFQLQNGSAGNGNVTITITDVDDPTCFTSIQLTDPGSCSNTCDLNNAGLSNIACNDNLSNSDPTDDYITFDLNPTGVNLGTNFNVSVSSGTVSPTSGLYATGGTFQLQNGSAGNGNVTITITDVDDPACSTTVTITDPGSCSTTCNLFNAGLSSLTCNDNNSPTNANDDFISFTLNPIGNNLGGTYTVSVNTGTISPTTGTYGVFGGSAFQLQNGSAGAGNVILTITDAADPFCTFTVNINDPGSCSTQCGLVDAGLNNLSCNDNNTASNPGDDFLSFDLNPTGANLGASFNVSVSSGTITPSVANYPGGSFQLQNGSAGAGNVVVTITDANDPSCFTTVNIIDPGACSNTCNLTSAGLANIACNDNLTNSDPSDDFISFDLFPVGNNLGTSFNVSVSSGTITPNNLPYPGGSFQLQNGSAGNGNISLTITDANDPSCSFVVNINDPGTCSPVCNISSVNLSGVSCNNNGTSSNPNDDFIGFIINASGTNTASNYSVSVSSGTISPNTGNYNVNTPFQLQTGSAGNGPVTLTLTDNATGTCTFDILIPDPGSCSPDCEIINGNLSAVSCNDNNTTSDPSDDFISFFLNPTGNNLSSGYSVSASSGTITPTTASYAGGPTLFQLQAGSAGNGNVTISITDNATGICNLNVLVIDPGSCSPQCDLISAGLSNLTCNDNSTADDPLDDYITFDLFPQGNNLSGSFNLSVSSGSVFPSSGTYPGGSFQLQNGAAGAGNVTLTITDPNDPFCNITVTITDPGACSNTCNLNNAGLANLSCNDNNTNSDGSDDYISFSLNPTGNNLGASYSVSVSSGSVSPSIANYGSLTNFQLQNGSAGNGNVFLTITDIADPTCSFVVNLNDPGSCSTTCEITNLSIFNVSCNDNGTTDLPSDDFISFQVNPTGNNLSSNYQISVSSGSVSPTIGTYGFNTIFQLQAGSAGAGNVTITVTDLVDGGCSFSLPLIDPGSCSTDCSINADGLANVTCDDNGTPNDPTDDIISFDLNPSGNNTSPLYNVSVVGGTVSPNIGLFGTSTTFSLQAGSAGAGNPFITITDGTDGFCFLELVVPDPGSCSNQCGISGVNLSGLTCNDNNTAADSGDDFLSFSLDPSGSNLAGSYTVSVSSGTISPSVANYGTATVFQLQNGSAGSGNVTVTVTDANDNSCTFDILVTDSGPCSNTCNLIDGGLSNINCNDNNTVSISTDDFISFDLNPTGSNLGTTYTISVSTGTISPTTGTYGSSTGFQLQNGSAGNGNVTITITDDTDNTCSFDLLLTDPGTCSNTCAINDLGLDNINCDDNNTNSDSSDDYISFSLNPQGLNLAGSYSLSVSTGTVSPSVANYGTITSFQLQNGSAGNGNVTLTVTDDADNSCSFDIVINDPGACSNTCDLTDIALSDVVCDDNNTGSDDSDDIISFVLNPTGNNLASNYSISVNTGSVSPSIANYNSPTVFTLQSGSAGAGNVIVTIVDNNDINCTISTTVIDPGACSNTCGLTDAGLSNLTCNDNNTAANSTDDFLSFDLNPIGSNLSSSYTLSVSSGSISPTIANYGSTTNFQLQNGSAGSGNVQLTITDNADSNCSITINITDPGACSNTCNLTNANLQNILCNDNNSPSMDSDDYLTFTLNPSGSNLGANYTISVNAGTVTPTTGVYGAITNFQLQNGSAGNGNVVVTITDDADNTCNLDVLLSDPGTCSDLCDLTDIGLSGVNCNDNGTDTDITDDFISFNLNPLGQNLSGNYNISVSTGSVSPNVGTYGSITNFQLQNGSAGNGNVIVTITDNADSNCSIMINLNDPGTCSDQCAIATLNLNNVLCNDNGSDMDPSDDFISFELNPSGANTGGSYTINVSSGSVSPTSATYGVPTVFQLQNGSAGAGNIIISLTDDNDNTCTATTTLVDPGSCSNQCGITDAGLSNLTCNDNNTSANSGDDFIVFELSPTGNNLATNYTVSVSSGTISPNSGTYNTATSFQLQNGSAGAGNVVVTITDNNDNSCDFTVNIVDPGPCSNTCNLTSAGLSNLACNDNNTASQDNDDFISFSLNPSGTNLGASYTLSVSSGSISPNTAVYGVPTNFQLQNGSAGAGNVIVSIVDALDNTCSFDINIIDPGACSDQCELISAGLSNIACNDNNTPNDASDDFISLSLNPTGNNLAGSVLLFVSSGNITPSSIPVGLVSNLSLQNGSAGAGNVSITLTDPNDSNCSITVVLQDPGSCSNQCEILSTDLDNVSCNDNNSPNDPSDDFISFSLNVTGNNLATTYSISSDAGLVSPSTGNYGAVTNFNLVNGTAGMGSVILTITDDNDNTCSTVLVMNDPGACSSQCGLQDAGLNNLTCNDNNSSADSSDDFLSFDLNPIGNNLGSGYSLTVSSGAISPSSANYGSPINFQLQNGSAGAGNVIVTITDNDDPSCSLNIDINDTGACSNTCNLTSSGIQAVDCNDNGTISDASDDFISFSINPTGTNLSSNYNLSVNIGTLNTTVGTYGNVLNLQLQNGSAGAGNVILTITDSANPSCSFDVLINDPGSCSDQCAILNAGLDNLTCNDNSTSSITDDFISFNLTPTGLNLAGSYSIVVNSGSISPSIGTFNNTTNFQLQNGSAGAGNVIVTITDDNDPSCSFDITINDTGSCSNQCNLTDPGLNNLSCNDNSTASDDTDDFLNFELNPVGSLLGTSYSVSVSSGTITPATANYGNNTNFQLQNGSAGAGNVIVTITDDNDPSCSFDITINDTGACSNQCNLTDAGLNNLSCNDNSTASNDTDDFMSFDLNPAGSLLGISYSVSVSSGTITPTTANYGNSTNFQLQNGSAGAGNVIVTITDDNDPSCSFDITINDTGSCSNQCNLTDAGLNNLSCNDNSTASDDTDDFLSFDLNPMGSLLGTSYSVSVSSGTITPTTANYGNSTNFQLQNGSAGAGNVIVTITDDNDPSCSFDITINDTGSCSNQCNLTDAGLNNLSCNDNSTASDDTDDFMSFDLNPMGSLLGTSYSVSVSSGTITPTTANYGNSTNFQLQNGSAGAGNVIVTITDDNDPSCSFDITINDTGSCSNQCNLTDAGLNNLSCNDNSTASDDTDDFLNFDLNPMGSLLGTSYSVSVSSGTITPTTANYGNSTNFQLQNGSAGAGNVIVTITDDNDPSCSFDITINDTGSCSNQCNLTDAGLNNLSCNDNSTASDDTDDFLSFDLNPMGSLLGTSYSVSVSSGTITPANANYGNSMNFQLQNGSAGAGNVIVTITDDNDPSCSFDITINDTGSCSNVIPCSLDDAGLTGVVCNDNGTILDDTDDFIVFSLNPTGNGLATTYNVSVNTGTVSPTSGNFGNPTNFQLQVGSAGAGNVIVTITDDQNNTCFTSALVLDPGTCSTGCPTTADAGPDMSIDCLNPTAILMGSSSSPNVSFTWTGPGIDATNENDQNPTVSLPGVYSLVVTDNTNNCDSPASTVTVFDNTTAPVAQVNFNGSLDCTTTSVLLDGSASTSGANIAYQWFYNSTLLAGANTNQYDAMDDGQYILVVANILTGCLDSDTVQVSLDNSTPVAIIANPQELNCTISSISLDATSSSDGPDIQYNWTTIGGNILTGGNTDMPTINQAGAYIIEVSNTTNGCAATDTVIVLQDITAPIANAGSDIVLGCNTSSATLDGSASSTGIDISYSWSGNVSNSTILSPTVDEAGIYTLTVSDASNGCTATDQVSVSIDPAVPSTILYSNTDPACFEDNNAVISIDSVVGGVGPFLYTIDNNAFSSNNNFNNLGAGVYNISIQDANGCELSEEVIINAANPVIIELGDNISLQLGDSVELNPQISILENQVDTIIWSPYASLNNCEDGSICFEPTITPTFTTTVSATLVDTNGCVANDQLTIFVEKEEFIYIPSAFSPNDDGYNDVFMIYGSRGVEQINAFRVYDRWGALLFEAENFQPNDPKHGWDGFFKNKKLNPAVFVYYAEVKFTDGHTTIYKGDVTLAR